MHEAPEKHLCDAFHIALARLEHGSNDLGSQGGLSNQQRQSPGGGRPTIICQHKWSTNQSTQSCANN